MTNEIEPIDETFVTVARIPDLIQADVIRSRLQAAGVDVFMANENTRALRHPWLITQPVKLQVPRAQVSLAREALTSMIDAAAEAGEEENEGPANKPKLDIRLPGTRFRGLIQILVALLGVVLVIKFLLWLLELL